MRAHARRDGLVHVAPEPAGDAAEQRRAVGRALLDGQPLQRDLEHRGDDLQPQLAARAAAGHAAALAARRTRSKESRSPQATPSSTARTSAPRSWRISRPVNAPRASGSACGVRSPVRYGRNVRPSAPGSHALGLGGQLGELAADDAAQPGAASPAAESITPIWCQAPGTAWQKAWTRACGSARYSGSAAKTTPRGAHRDQSGPGRSTPDAEPARGLVARAGRDGDARSRVRPETSGDSSTVGSHAAVDLERVEHLVAPAPLRDVEQQRAGGVGDVDRPLAGELAAARSPWAASRARCARSSRARACAATAASGAVKPVSARLPVSSTRRSKPTRSSISAHSAPVRWSFQRIAGRIGRSAASSVTSPCIWPERPMPATPSVRPSSACSVASHQSSGFCSDQPGRGVDSGYGDFAALEHLAVLGDRDDLHRGGSDVDADGDA